MPVQRTPPLVLRKHAVCILLGISSTTFDRMRRNGDLPAPIRLSVKAIGWRSTDIDSWVASRPTATR